MKEALKLWVIGFGVICFMVIAIWAITAAFFKGIIMLMEFLGLVFNWITFVIVAVAVIIVPLLVGIILKVRYGIKV